MTFAEPLALLLLAVVPPAAWLVWRRLQEQRAALGRFGDRKTLTRSSALPAERSSRLRASLPGVVLGFVGPALARPQFGDRRGDLVQTGRDILVLLDLSRSMTVTDLSPTRLAVAKRAAWETVSASPGDRVGLE